MTETIATGNVQMLRRAASKTQAMPRAVAIHSTGDMAGERSDAGAE